MTGNVISASPTAQWPDRDSQPHIGDNAMSIHSVIEVFMGGLATFHGVYV